MDPGRPKQRAVLALLLINANRVVSLDRFADLLWPEGSADRGTGSVPVYIANLRRLLEPERPPRSPPQVLLTRAPGYVLCVEDDDHDATAFQSLAAEGARQLALGRPSAARRALGEALALWRGRAFEEFALEPFAEMEAARLEELRITATQDRLGADLALGAHSAVVAELEALVGEHPLREELWGLLMLALYRSGRQAEALRAYGRARERMAVELGLEPGPVLRGMEAAVLAQSPALAWLPPAPEGEPAVRAAAPPVRPAQTGNLLVGRQPELAAIDEALHLLGKGVGSVVLVSGEPGIGKTRLAQEAAARAEARGATVAWGRADEGDGAPAFWPWMQVIRELLHASDLDAVRAALEPGAAEIAQVVPDVRDVLGDVHVPSLVDPAEARFRFYSAVHGFLQRLGRRSPLVVVIDDVHWADPLSLRLTEHVAGALGDLSVLLVVTYRDVDPAPSGQLIETLGRLARHSRRVELSLGGLRQDEVARVMADAAASEPPADVVAAVWERTDGNPFFVGELTRLLVAENALDDAAAGRAALPGAVRHVIRQRVARLPDDTRRLITVAAVAGQEFRLDVVAAAATVDDDHALDLVDLAIARGVVTEDRAVVGRFRFSHSLVQETIYGGVTSARRARLHGMVGDALERVGGDRAMPTELAHHYYEAVPALGPEKAIAAAIRASETALAAFAYEAAEHHLRRAIALVETMPAGPARDRYELDAQDHLAAVLTLLRGVAVSDTAEAWERATELSRELEDRLGLLRSLWGRFSFAWASGDLEGAAALGRQVLEIDGAGSDSAVTAAGLFAVGSIAFCAGDIVEASRRLASAKALADSLPEESLAEVTFADVRVQVDSWLAVAVELRGEHAEGRRLVDGLLSRARWVGDPFTVAIALAFAAFAGALAGRPDALRDAQELFDHAEQHQLADFAYHASVVRAWARTGPAPDGAGIVGTAGIRPWRPFWLALQTEACLRDGRLYDAEPLLDEAFDEVAGMGGAFCTAELHRLRGELLAASGPQHRGEAEASIRSAIALADTQGAVLYRRRAEESLSRLLGT